MVKDAIGKIIEAVGVSGIIATLIITILVWLYYDFSNLQETLNNQEVIGVFAISLILVAFVQVVIMHLRDINKDKPDE